MPDEEIDDISVDDIVIPSQEPEEDLIEFAELNSTPSSTMAPVVQEEIDDDAIEFGQLYETPESEPDEVPVVETEPDQEPAVEEAVVQEIPQSNTISEQSNREIRSASTQLENIVQSMVGEDTNSLAATEIDIMEAKKFLSLHKLGRAKNSVIKAE
ncbi:MAG: hypothetical protein CMA92_04700, partial [Euryarchaeota archaeon]|nr:hypothetical protein [Euryarchaeota archaeon]